MLSDLNHILERSKNLKIHMRKVTHQLSHSDRLLALQYMYQIGMNLDVIDEMLFDSDIVKVFHCDCPSCIKARSTFPIIDIKPHSCKAVYNVEREDAASTDVDKTKANTRIK